MAGSGVGDTPQKWQLLLHRQRAKEQEPKVACDHAANASPEQPPD
jgi:hypothetical protein